MKLIEKTKNIMQIVLLLVIVGVVIAVFIKSCCKEDDEPVSVVPKIKVEKPDSTITVTPVNLSEIKKTKEWKFLDLNGEEMVKKGRPATKILGKEIGKSDELACIFRGTLYLGIDLKDTIPGWLSQRNDTVFVKLPKAKLLNQKFIDESKREVIVERGDWEYGYESLRDLAELRMKERLLTEDNYEKAKTKAIEEFTKTLKNLGAKNVVAETVR